MDFFADNAGNQLIFPETGSVYLHFKIAIGMSDPAFHLRMIICPLLKQHLHCISRKLFSVKIIVFY